ncbi:MAG: glycosyltransferase family 1 protein, partial [Gemmatimonadaceae bacterium]|nr:glycosyltransferase family 1 protein [Gemmatimonadaceae bacterium]
MRVMYCTDTWAPQVNGVTVVTVRSLEGLMQRGWGAAVVAPEYPAGTPGVPAPAIVPGGVLSLPSAAFPNYPDIRATWPGLGRIRRAMRAFAPDLVHCATEFLVGRAGLWTARALGIPVVTSYHTDFARYAGAYGTPWLERPIRMAIRRFHAQAARTFTPGRSALDDLAAMGIEHGVLWGRGVDGVRFSPARRDATWRTRLLGNAPADACLVGCVSRLAPEKGVDVVLEAFARAVAVVGPDRLRLVIAGTGPAFPALQAAAGPGVTFLGTLDRDAELPAVYAACDLFAFASLTETLGLVVLEAMASGVPVVATPALGVAESLRDDVNGCAVPPRDAEAMAQALVRLAADTARRRRLAEGALATAASFS